jgi:tRNA A-37 threonylcarbamoyl transferase component Bud32
LLAPRIDPKYEIVRKLREGGMGAIYLVRHRLLDELRVVKVLRSQLNTDEDLRQRFLREAKTAIQLRHPNIAQLYDFSVDEEGNASIVLEYIDGVTLEEFGRRPEARHLQLDLSIAQQALRAIGFLHRKGFVHRDIAPDNLMLTRDVDGEPLVKLIDLGIVKILRGGEGKGTATSLYLGKPRYSSPEQLTSPEIDARADLYSFGVMLYELVTGCYPIRGHDLPSLIAAHLHMEPVSFDVSDPESRLPEELRGLLLACMAKEPAGRPASAEELAARLAEIGRGLPAPEAGEAARLIDAARAGSRDERERELSSAGNEALSALDRGDFVAARARLQVALERLGNDPELVDLGRRVDARERERRVADAEAERLERLLAEAEAALAARDVPGALSKATEVLARRPNDPRARSVAARIDALRREEEARSAERAGAEARAAHAADAADAGDVPVTLRVRRGVEPSLHEAPTHELRVPDFAAGGAADFAADAGVRGGPRATGSAFGASGASGARGARGAGTHPPLRWLALGGLGLAVVVGGWLLWRGMTGDGGGDGGAGAATVPPAYGEALAALAAQDPETAARLLRGVLTTDRTERAGFLPHFYYGQALAALGECEEALRSFDASERQGAIAGQPEAASLPGARQRCASVPPPPDLETPLRQVETTLAELDRKIAEIEGTRASAEVARVWQANPELGRALAGVQDKVRRARDLSSRARAERDLGLAFQAGDLAADARDELAGLLTSVSDAIRTALADG